MRIIRDKAYLDAVDVIVDFIADDSLQRALDFLNLLDNKIDNLAHMPRKYRRSYFYDSEHVRDMVFKGYTITYLIDEKKDVIVILDIYKWRKR